MRRPIVYSINMTIPTLQPGQPTKSPAALQLEAGAAGDGEFIRRIVIAGLFIGAGAALWYLVDVLLLAFGAILLAVALRGLSTRLRPRIGGSAGLSLTIVILLLIAAVGLVFWAFGSQVAAQYDEIVDRAPAGMAGIVAHLRAHPVSGYLIDHLNGFSISSATGPIASAAARAIGSALQGLAYAAFAIFGGIYLAVDPQRYQAGALRLFPPVFRARLAQVLEASGRILEKWLLGQLVVMATIGTLSGLGLWALGIDAAFALGLTGGLLCFVPFVGAILAAVPATLMAFSQSPVDAAYTVLLFMGVHFVEGNFITPLVQDEAVALPPVISVFATLVFTILFGPFAVIVAVPITIVGLVVLKMLYVEDALERKISADNI